MKIRRPVLPLAVAAIGVLLPAACTHTESDDWGPTEPPVAVSFGASLQNVGETRATYPDETAGPMTTERLRTTSFGVFAAYTEGDKYEYNAEATGQKPFNFMWNQPVSWSTDDARWQYTPVKYWPNDNQPADDQDDGTGSNPAQGSREHSYVSFMAYAPYMDESALPKTIGDNEGIVAMTDNEKASGEHSYLTYRNATMLGRTSVDLLWSRQMDRYKMDGGGYTTGHVDFRFIHALSKVLITVRTLVDEAKPENNWPEYSDEVDANTRILIESVSITSPTVYTQARMYYAPRPADAVVPYWSDHQAEQAPTVNGENIHSDLRYTGNPANQTTTALAEADFNALPKGVTSTDHDLFQDKAYPYLTFIPTTGEEPLTVQVKYHVITYDPSLVLNNPRYYSIVANDISYTATEKFRFEANKVYTLRLLLGLTTVKFVVEGIDDWAVPISLDGVVRDPDEVTKELNVP